MIIVECTKIPSLYNWTYSLYTVGSTYSANIFLDGSIEIQNDEGIYCHIHDQARPDGVFEECFKIVSESEEERENRLHPKFRYHDYEFIPIE